MGQFLGAEQKKEKEIGPIIDWCYEDYFSGAGDGENWTSADFYHAVCQTVEEINRAIGSTQIRVPRSDTVRAAYDKHHKGKGKRLTKNEFQNIVQMVILDSGITSFGAIEILLYIYGAPIAAWAIKQRLGPKSIPNEVFIPAITSATVYLLAKLSKI
ncbi:uncharacterized protein LOC127256760 [Andrographis paniculata]|uniref:uncharacterized protein LOC127256760 n=1 Tax=Andrographis paniculata TaxID=175694 RepID=UPI0021E8A5CF|nr:uncharacterized protein LOC127256760 [Andrographis paniculata]